jgi:hypothetical protein
MKIENINHMEKKEATIKLFILQKVKFHNDTHSRFSIRDSRFSD